MSITGSNNPFACQPVVFANANSIVSLGTITKEGNQFTFSVGFVWKINGVTYQNTAPVVLTIAEASTGFERIDNALLNTSNTIELQQGLESETIALQPVAPDTNIILTFWNISGDAIETPTPPTTGSQFKQKNESQKFTQPLGGTNAVIDLQTYGQQYYAVVGPVTSIAGFSKALLTATPRAEFPYNGKDYYFENKTDHDVTLKNNFSGVDVKFNLGADLVVPSNGIVWFKYNASTEKMDLFFKSWADPIDLSTKADLVGGKVPASQLPSYVDDVIEGYFNGTNFYTDAGFTNLITPESGKIYINIAVTPATQYRWSGSAYVQIGAGIDFPSDGKTYGVKAGLAERIDLIFSNANIQGIANTSGGSAFATIVTAGNGAFTGTLGSHGYYGSIPFGSISSPSTLGSVANYRTGNWFQSTQNSFFVTETFVTISNSVAPLTSRLGIGYFAYAWSGLSNVNPSIHARIAFCNDNGEDFLKLSYREYQSSAVINISLGSLFPARFAKNEHVYLCKFYFLNNQAIATIFDLVTGNYYESPLLNCSWSEANGLIFVAHINNNTTAEVVSLGFNGFLNKFRYGF